MRYPLSAPDSISPAAIEAGIGVLRSGQFTMGAQVDAFEAAFATAVGARHAVMVNSGSSANLLAVEALLRPSHGPVLWRPGDEILVPALAWPTTVWPLVQLGLVPVFVDVRPDTLSLDWARAAEVAGPRTRGVMLIHVLGCPADMHGWWAWFSETDRTILVEDCCESFGSTVGLTGAMATYSHFFAHQLSTMEGGTITTNDDALADDLRSMRAHGWTRNRLDRARLPPAECIDPRFHFVTTGYNLRPTEVQGAMGVVQLRDVQPKLTARRLTVGALTAAIQAIPWLRVPSGSWTMNLPILVEADAPFRCAAVMRHFEAAGVETRPILAGNLLHHPVMARIPHRVDPAGYPVADRIMRDGFMVGCHGQPGIAVDCIAEAVQVLQVAA